MYDAEPKWTGPFLRISNMTCAACAAQAQVAPKGPMGEGGVIHVVTMQGCCCKQSKGQAVRRTISASAVVGDWAKSCLQHHQGPNAYPLTFALWRIAFCTCHTALHCLFFVSTSKPAASRFSARPFPLCIPYTPSRCTGIVASNPTRTPKLAARERPGNTSSTAPLASENHASALNHPCATHTFPLGTGISPPPCTLSP